MAESSPGRVIPLERRLKALMSFRVLLATVLLGGTIAIDVDQLASLSEPRNVALLSLIVVTYLLTIIYALLLEQLEELRGLAVFQLVADMVLVGVLVLFTRGLDSLFIFLFYLNIINAAIVAGRMAALWIAGATVLILSGLGLVTAAQLGIEFLDLPSSGIALLPMTFEIGVNAAAAFLIAFLAGQLTQRLGEVSGELEQTESDLRQLQTLTRNIVASLSSGLVTVDDQGRVIFVNEAASDILGPSQESLVGMQLDQLAPAFTEAIESEHKHPKKGNQSQSRRRECEYAHPDGQTRFLGFSHSPLREEAADQSGHIIVFQDLTEIKRLEKKNRRAERLAAVGELAASIAHEIRNPLASISGSVEMLQQTASLDETDQNLMQIILREVDRLDVLISEFLDYSRPSELNMEAVDLENLVRDVVSLFSNRNGTPSVELTIQASESTGSLMVRGDQESLRQIVWNLLNNAESALADADGEADPRIRVALSGPDSSSDSSNQTVEITVDDNGPGIDDEDIDHIFEPFFTTREEGSGLGLATTYRLIEEHEGTVEVEANGPLGGARFSVQLPVAA
jgi:two-component system sensor histidine kinase PilS (NtrC family)